MQHRKNVVLAAAVASVISMGAQAQLEDLFKETFGLQVVLQIPYTIAANLLDPDQEKELAAVTPEIFI